MKDTVSNEVTYRVETPDGSVRLLCDIDCVERYLTATQTPDAWLKTEPVRLKTSCAGCAWCGQTVAVPIRCVLHDDECPEFHPLATIRALQAVQRLQQRTKRFLPPRGFEYLEMAAHGFHTIGLEGTAAQLVDKVWESSPDWEWPTR